MVLYSSPTLKICSRGDARYLFRTRELGGTESSHDHAIYSFHEGFPLIVTEQMLHKRRSALYLSPTDHHLIMTAALPYTYDGPVLVPEEAFVSEKVDIYQIRDKRHLLLRHKERVGSRGKALSMIELQRFYESFTAALPER